MISSRRPPVCVLYTCMAVLIPFLSACSPQTPKPGFSGSVPSPAGQHLLDSIEGTEFTDSVGTFGGGNWVVRSWAVVPNPVTGKGPVVQITRPGAPPVRRYDAVRPDLVTIPVATDGDVADLYLRVTGKSAPGVTGELSAQYRKATAK